MRDVDHLVRIIMIEDNPSKTPLFFIYLFFMLNPKHSISENNNFNKWNLEHYQNDFGCVQWIAYFKMLVISVDSITRKWIVLQDLLKFRLEIKKHFSFSF